MILAFGWFGFNPGSTLGASGNGALRIGIVAVDTMLASMTGAIFAMGYMWYHHQEARSRHDLQRLPGGPGGHHRALGLRQPA